MLFNSFPFLFVFLPICLIGYQIAGHLHRRGVVAWLGLSSLAFYAYWNPRFLLVLGTSILFNYFVACLISRRIPNNMRQSLLLWLAILGNLGALCYFKYLFPLLGFFTNLAHSNYEWAHVALPLGISFFTFTQIAYLIDLQQGAAEQQDFASYLVFVTFFPHLIAGPILHHKDIMPQFQEDRDYRLNIDDLAVGFSIFIIGMFKKVILADTLSKFVDQVFSAPGQASRSYLWVGVLSYALQLYFDFSGYSDMAIGLARMVLIEFPLNFASPYKASNIIDYWNRWHMTLTQYIMSYVFTPIQIRISTWRQSHGLKVSRKALTTPSGFFQMIVFPTFFTMGIAGIWHGAGFQYILFGVCHGFYLSTAHGWRILRASKPQLIPGWIQPWFRHIFSVGLTLLAVMIGQIIFRSRNTSSAFLMLDHMFSLHKVVPASPMLTSNLFFTNCLWLPIGFFIVWFLPNTQQILKNFKPSLALAPSDLKPPVINVRWQPSTGWAIALSFALMLSLVHFMDPSTFLYFQF